MARRLFAILVAAASVGFRRHSESVALNFLQEKKTKDTRGSFIENRTAKSHTTKKQVKVHIESGCPDSQAFCLGELKQALDPFQGLTNLIDVSLVAWGNAYHLGVVGCESHTSTQYNSDGSRCWQRSCKNGTLSSNCFNEAMTPVHQHGTKEGEVDRLLNCAFKYSSNPWPYAQCLLAHYEGTDTVAAIAETCKDKIGSQADAVEGCASSDEGMTLLMQAAEATPKHRGVPYVTIDGESIDPDNFFQELCPKLHSAQVPPACAHVGNASATPTSLANMSHVTAILATNATVAKQRAPKLTYL